MASDDILLLTLLAAFLIMVIAGFYVIKDEYLSKRQKIFQLILIFSLPFLGALVAWSLNQSMEEDNAGDNSVSGSRSHNNTTVTPTDDSGDPVD